MHKHDAENETTHRQETAVTEMTQDSARDWSVRYAPVPETTNPEDAGAQTERVAAESADAASIARRVKLPHGFHLTAHAWVRMTARAIPTVAVEMALAYGRKVRVHGARYYVLRRREIDRARRSGLDFRQYEGIQVVASAEQPIIYTVYRNRDFKHTLRAARRPWRTHH